MTSQLTPRFWLLVLAAVLALAAMECAGWRIDASDWPWGAP